MIDLLLSLFRFVFAGDFANIFIIWPLAIGVCLGLAAAYTFCKNLKERFKKH